MRRHCEGPQGVVGRLVARRHVRVGFDNDGRAIPSEHLAAEGRGTLVAVGVDALKNLPFEFAARYVEQIQPEHVVGLGRHSWDR